MAETTFAEWMARIGYAARGLVYLIIGGFAVLAAFGSGGRTTGGKGALHAFLAAPFGRALLGLVALGLLGFALWRILQGAFDADRLGREPKAVMRRIVYAGSAAIYVGLAYSAVRLMLGLGESSDNQAAQDWTATLLSEPFGPWLVGAVGAGLVIGGIGTAMRGCREDLASRLSVAGLLAGWAVPLGRFGFVARGVVFVLGGAFLILAALHLDSSEARGLGGALRWLERQPYGGFLLGSTALGLFAFGAFQLVLATCRRIDAPTPSQAAATVKTDAGAAQRAFGR